MKIERKRKELVNRWRIGRSWFWRWDRGRRSKAVLKKELSAVRFFYLSSCTFKKGEEIEKICMLWERELRFVCSGRKI